jgi:hypothetical protein
VAAIIASDNVIVADSTILDGLSANRKLSRNRLRGSWPDGNAMMETKREANSKVVRPVLKVAK